MSPTVLPVGDSRAVLGAVREAVDLEGWRVECWEDGYAGREAGGA